jgi:hypothetical protein
MRQVFLYGSLILRDEQRLKEFENRVPRRISGPKRGKIIGGWTKLPTEGLHNLCSSPKIIRMIKARRMRWIGHVASMRRRGLHAGFS